MTTRRNNAARKFLEDLAGRPLSLGGLLESLRLGEEISLTVFAKKLKISSSHLCDIEKGRKAVSVVRAVQFAKILGHSETQFVRLALQDELNRSGINLKVQVEVA